MHMYYYGLELDFAVCQALKYHLFIWPPFLRRSGDLLFEVADYTRIPLEGWRLLILIRHWLNENDRKVFLKGWNQDLQHWIVLYKQEAHFPRLDGI